METIKIEVDNCLTCPFSNHDNEYGCDSCNLNDEITTKGYEQLPKDKRHEKCPLNNSNYEIIGL